MICDQCETVAHCTKYGCIPERIGKPKPAAQPAVPDAIGPNEDELPAYAAGWNDCRQAMLEMMK
jgi:hypothetical protein